MKIFFLLNPTDRKRLWDLRELASQVAHRHGWTARFGEVDRHKPKSTERLLDQAVEEGCSRIVLVGGDGTYHRAINALQEMSHLRDLEIAFVPAGTCNDFARSLGLSKRRLSEAMAVACKGTVRETDLGALRLGGAAKPTKLFLNNAGFGRRAGLKRGERNTARRTLQRFQPTALRVTWDKGSIEGRFYFGVVCNAPFFSKGLHFSRAPRIDDGLLDAYLVPVLPRWKLAAALVRGRLGGTLMVRGVVALRVARLEIESEADLWPQADGESLPEKPVRRVAFGIAAQKAMIVFPS